MNHRKNRDTILVADDEPSIRSNLSALLKAEGYNVIEAADGLEAARVLQESSINLVLLDLNMPGRNGMELLREHADRLEATSIIVITAYGGSSAAIEAMKLGAFDYITKPFDLDEVLFAVKRALTQQALSEQVRLMSETAPELERDFTEEDLIGRSPGMLNVFKLIGRVAASREPVLIVGESGTGKELVANAIHRSSARSERPFVKVNSAALSSSLLESELFGHERGAFTGALVQRIGRFEQANGGTLFLDEIGDMDVELQAKLLRVLQLGQFERVGGNETIQTDVRVVSATNRDLQARIANGEFREDLFYRLNVVSIELPPLRERADDIPLIVDHLVHGLMQKYGWPNLVVSQAAMAELVGRPWPGNVRELQNTVSRAAVLACGRVIQIEHLAKQTTTSLTQPPLPFDSLNLRDAVAETERRVISQALEQESWNRTRTAQVLGISRRQLFDKMRQYELRDS